MKRSARIIILVVGIIAIIGMAGYIILRSHLLVDMNTNVTPALPSSRTITVKDFAPSLPINEKTTILIQQSDSSEVKYLVPTNQVDTYIKSLPEGDHVLSKTP
jgi:hypothetical protein